MTINYARESVIDFTKPFMNLGISILFKVSVERDYNGFGVVLQCYDDVSVMKVDINYSGLVINWRLN